MPITIAGRTIGREVPPYVIAEAGVNHNGEVSLALRLVDAAAASGADAVKFQTFRASALATADAPQAAYQHARVVAASQREMLTRLELPHEALRELQARATEHGITFISTPFDIESLDSLVTIGVPAVKIGSGDLTNLPLVRAAAATARPLILSTGMATMDEIAQVVAELDERQLILLHCTSAYPAPIGESNLRAIESLRSNFDAEVGFSDHTVGLTAAIAAVALGAVVIEKHLTLDRAMPGPDHAASLEPDEFATMVVAVRDAHAALGDGTKVPQPSESDALRVARRSVVARRSIPAGYVLEQGDLDVKRPGTGISPLEIDRLIGAVTLRPLAADTIITIDDVQLDPGSTT